MRSSTKNEIAGKIHEAKGKIKEKVGQLTNNTDLEAEGIGEKIGGKIQKKIGQVEKAVEEPRTGTASHERAATTLRFGSRNRAKTGGRS